MSHKGNLLHLPRARNMSALDDLEREVAANISLKQIKHNPDVVRAILLRAIDERDLARAGFEILKSQYFELNRRFARAKVQLEKLGVTQ